MNEIAIQNKTVREIAGQHTDSYKIFHKYGIDFCCGGKRLLSDVCEEKGIEISEIANDFVALEKTPSDQKDWKTETLENLINHIVDTHHQYLRDDLPRLFHLTQKVASRHGERDTHLYKVLEVYVSMANELLAHIEKEERVLFPMIIEMEKAGDISSQIMMPILAMEAEHEEAGAALEELNRLTESYAIKPNMCASYQALYVGLKQLEKDLKLHIHKENNILFPRVQK
ncbi:MAG: iron-sulfur cluster repair di-iron protein [Alphaproteobacteria bacterium]|nr:iron-sulfur cluster repair di-iron protein [Alphaproteobacteria bacterium]